MATRNVRRVVLHTLNLADLLPISRMGWKQGKSLPIAISRRAPLFMPLQRAQLRPLQSAIVEISATFMVGRLVGKSHPGIIVRNLPYPATVSLR